MVSKLSGFKDLKLSDITGDTAGKIESISKKDIAIIGMAGKFAGANNMDEFWENLRQGKDCIRDFPESRQKDANVILRNNGIAESEIKYLQGGYLDEVDKFDCNFFKLSPIEASLMDPNQRLFLETAWEAIENSGYGGRKLSGTRTGLYVGHNSDFDEKYETFIRVEEPSSIGLAVPGNIKPIIASRISYLLDLKGPSLLVDTACSSTLLAVHLACQGMRNGECEMAIAGGVKVNLIPAKSTYQDGIGIQSSTGRTRTFDDASDGTGFGEVVAAVVLKPLKKALEDGDTVYAVIKGSAVNQDGSSIGITAPNASAQEDAIAKAWKEAGVNPETISYIEAHGTGTKLGDPIEIDGVTMAFRKFTNKKQFCAIGSVKTNIGHTDHTAGMAALIKATMALKHRELPPSLNFGKPNRKIDFENSPVYINDRLAKWETDGHPLRCGISSFGLSGTNCHLILEEAPAAAERREKAGVPGKNVLALSARTEKALKELIARYSSFFSGTREIHLGDVCYTANTGRGHYNCRLAIIAKDAGDCGEKLKKLTAADLNEINEKDIYYMEHKVVAGEDKKRSPRDVTENDKRVAGQEANEKMQAFLDTGDDAQLEAVCRHYVKGADADWEVLYGKEKRRRTELPVYPFERKRCWVERENGRKEVKPVIEKEISHPLLDVCLAESPDTDIYATTFSVDRHWVLSEHKVVEDYVVPGTTYIELARAVGKRYYSHGNIGLKDIMFISRLAVKEGEQREVKIVVNHEDGFKGFSVASKSEDGNWLRHVEGKIYGLEAGENKAAYDIGKIMTASEREETINHIADPEVGVHVGPRFKNLKKVYFGKDEVLAFLELAVEYHKDLESLFLHPALMDSSVNIAIGSLDGGFYLPLSYKGVKIYEPMPARLYSYLRAKSQVREGSETISFDISLMDENGNICVDIEDYTIKKVHLSSASQKKSYYEIAWVPQGIIPGELVQNKGAVLVLEDQRGTGAKLAERLRAEGRDIIEVELAAAYSKLSENKFTIKGMEEDYQKLLAELKNRSVSQILHLLTLSAAGELSGPEDLQQSQQMGVYSLFYLVKALLSNKIHENIDVVLISDYVSEVSGGERVLKPHNATMFGLGKVVGQEYSHLACRCIDMDDTTSLERIAEELSVHGHAYQVAYRSGQRYVEEFRRVDEAKLTGEGLDIKNGGTYIITGGAGAIGLEMSKTIAAKQKVNLCLINRSPMPEREQWDGILQSGENTRLCARILAVREIEAAGSEVSFYNADISDMARTKEAFDGIREKYGRIHGVIHAAGVAGDGFVIKKDESVFANVISPKVNGTFVLDRLTREDNPDFFILFSSVATLFGTPGQGDYTAANSYLDAFASYRNKQGRRTLSIDWPAWKEVGMAVEHNVNDDNSLFRSVTNRQGVSAFEELGGSKVSRAIPGELNLDILSAVAGELPIRLSDRIKAEVDKHKRQPGDNESTKNEGDTKVALKGKLDGDYTETENKLAVTWAGMLKLDEVDIYDNFYDLGGDSILATRLLKEMGKVFGDLVDISDIFSYPTIHEMARYIDGKLNKTEHTNKEVYEEDIDDILLKLSTGAITAGEAEKLFKLEDE